MEHTKKLILVDPRFSRPTMKDKVLSRLDDDISSILDSDVSDEVKARNYASALSRFKAISSPPRGPPPPPGLQPQAAVAAVPALQPQPKAMPATYKTRKPPKRLHKRTKLPAVDDPSFWQRELRTPSKRNLGTQWVSLEETPKKRKNTDTPTKRKKKQTGLGHGIEYQPFSP